MNMILETILSCKSYLAIMAIISFPIYFIVKYAIVNCFGDIYGKDLVETCTIVKHDHRSNLWKFKSLEKSVNELRTDQKKTLRILEKLLDEIEHKDR